jgi:hypothetical protein
MAGQKFLKIDTADGNIKEVVSVQTGTADSIPSLDATGRLDSTMMPIGIGADTLTITTSENLADGDFINIYDNASTPTARKADASNGYEVNGFVIASSSSGQDCTVYFEGVNDHLSGLTGGLTYFLSATTAGEATTVVPTTAGHIVQKIGRAVATGAISLEFTQAITLA